MTTDRGAAETPAGDRPLPPSAAQRQAADMQALARVAAGLFFGGAALGAAVMFIVPTPPAAYEPGVVACILASAAVGLLVLQQAGHMRARDFHWMEGFATLLITAGLTSSGQLSGGAPIGIELLYLCPTLITAYFMTARGATAHVGLIAIAYGTALLLGSPADGAATRWLVTIGSLALASWAVLHLRARSDRDLQRSIRSTELLRATLEATGEGILVIRNDRVVKANNRLTAIWHDRRALDSALEAAGEAGVPIDSIDDPEGLIAGVVPRQGDPSHSHFHELELSDGRVLERYSHPQYDGEGKVLGRVISYRDVTQRRRLERELRRLADRDPLTELFNRRRFEQELELELSRAGKDGRNGAVLLLDIDNFKHINDTVGHRGGDEVIRTIGQLLLDTVGPGEVVARLGGDELAIILPRTDEKCARDRAEEIGEMLRTHPFCSDSQPLRATISIGVATFGKTHLNVADVLSAADRALYDAKDQGRDRVVMHDSRLERGEMDGDVTWTRRIREAIDEDRLILHAQPILELASGEITRHELLVRILDADGTVVPPGAFLPHAERYGQVKEIDAWVFGEAVRLIAEAEAGGQEISLEVNVSAASVADPAVPDRIRKRVLEAEIDPASLTFELTETAAIASMGTARTFAEAVSSLGCAFALDDFGSGFGSFYYLKHFPVDLIKIDGDFVQEIESSEIDRTMVESIVQIASKLGMRTVAEFATTDGAVKLLRELGVDFAQGYAIGRLEPVSSLALGPAPHHRSSRRRLGTPLERRKARPIK